MHSTLTDSTRALVRAAASADLAYALWRMPGDTAFYAVISTGPVEPRAVFSAEPAQPFFALGRFDMADPAKPTAIRADVLATPNGINFFEGSGFTDDPVTDAQKRLTENQIREPLRAKPGPLPEQTSKQAYRQLVGKVLAAIEEGPCRKIVLSRAEARPLPSDHDLADITQTLAQHYPSAFVALVSTPQDGTWLTATPETLLRVDANMISTMALAGTQWPEPGTDPASLSWPDKIIEEQSLVALYIREAFAASGISDVNETQARGVRAANLCHLRSDFTAPRDTAGPKALSKLLSTLHPTSAVCGLPRDKAMEFLRAHEGYDRRCYTGYLGPVGIEGHTDLFVNLRSAQIIGDQLCLYVGGGIVPGSDPDLEWQETVEKTKTIAAVLS